MCIEMNKKCDMFCIFYVLFVSAYVTKTPKNLGQTYGQKHTLSKFDFVHIYLPKCVTIYNAARGCSGSLFSFRSTTENFTEQVS